MATLDYALLAEYARIDPAGLVTIVGGSFDRVQAMSTSGAHPTYLVMRVLLDESEEAASFEVSVEPPNKVYALQLTGTAARHPAAVPVDGRVGVTLTIGLMVPIVAAGLYVARVSQSRPCRSCRHSRTQRFVTVHAHYLRTARERQDERACDQGATRATVSGGTKRPLPGREGQQHLPGSH